MNKGFINNGGTVKAEQIAVGDHALNIQSISANALEKKGQSDLAKRLTALEQAIAANEASIQDPSELRAASTKLAGELSKEEPDKDVVLGVMERLKRYAASATGIASAVASLWELLSHTL